jgi:hypothetical protein
MNAPRKISRRLNQIEVVAMSKVMDQHIRLLPKTAPDAAQYCEYEDGWDDDRVAKQIAPDLGKVHAENLRENIYGLLAPRVRTEADPEVLRRLSAIEATLATFDKLLVELIGKHDKLCAGISVARVGVDARHLRMEPNKEN